MPTMRAIQVAAKGGPFELVERELPVPGPGEVRVKVQACGVCHSDSMAKEGLFPNLKYPLVPGHEIAVMGFDPWSVRPGGLCPLDPH